MRIVLFLLFVLAPSLPAAAQPLVANPTPASVPGIRQEGTFLTAPVRLDGATLFRIAAPASPQPGQVPIQTRQIAVENALAQLILTSSTDKRRATLYDPRTIAVRVVSSNQQAVLEATDETHPVGMSIVTATPVDAKYNGMTVTSVADRWQGILQTALRGALLKRQPGVERRNVVQVLVAAAVLVVASVLIWMLIVAPIRQRARGIERRLDDQEAKDGRAEAEPPGDDAPVQRRRRFLATALRAQDPERQLGILRAIAATSIWVLVLVWFAVLVWAFSLFPQTTPLAHQVVQTLLSVVATWIGAGLFNRLMDLAIARLAIVWRLRHFVSAEDRARELLRIPTFTAAISGGKTAVIIFIALLVTLGEIGVPVWSVVTFGGLTAIGITLAAQNFVRDFVNGFLVLVEDQYIVGDYVTLSGRSGVVENLTLRMAQIRDAGGNLVTIPHSSVTYVVNHSRNWSRVDYRVSVDPATDTAKALELVRRAIESVAHEAQWRDVIPGPIEWIGVDSLSRDGVIIRASIKTAPLRQFEARRAINERVLILFSNAGIALGLPVAESPP